MSPNPRLGYLVFEVRRRSRGTTSRHAKEAA
jgi:hypothetical protein